MGPAKPPNTPVAADPHTHTAEPSPLLKHLHWHGMRRGWRCGAGHCCPPPASHRAFAVSHSQTTAQTCCSCKLPSSYRPRIKSSMLWMLIHHIRKQAVFLLAAMHSTTPNKHKMGFAYLVILGTSSKGRRKPKFYIQKTP